MISNFWGSLAFAQDVLASQITVCRLFHFECSGCAPRQTHENVFETVTVFASCGGRTDDRCHSRFYDNKISCCPAPLTHPTAVGVGYCLRCSRSSRADPWLGFTTIFFGMTRRCCYFFDDACAVAWLFGLLMKAQRRRVGRRGAFFCCTRCL